MKTMGQDTLVSAADLAKHTTEDDCWITIHGKVYNVSSYLVDHPGGLDVMMEHAGAVRVPALTCPSACRCHRSAMIMSESDCSIGM